MNARPQPVIERRGDGTTACTFRPTADHPGFDGHFPGDPVLPAMCHVDLALHAVACVSGRPQDLLEVRRARFRRKVVPGEALRIELRPDAHAPDGAALWCTRHTVDGERAAELELLCAPRDPD